MSLGESNHVTNGGAAAENCPLEEWFKQRQQVIDLVAGLELSFRDEPSLDENDSGRTLVFVGGREVSGHLKDSEVTSNIWRVADDGIADDQDPPVLPQQGNLARRLSRGIDHLQRPDGGADFQLVVQFRPLVSGVVSVVGMDERPRAGARAHPVGGGAVGIPPR